MFRIHACLSVPVLTSLITVDPIRASRSRSWSIFLKHRDGVSSTVRDIATYDLRASFRNIVRIKWRIEKRSNASSCGVLPLVNIVNDLYCKCEVETPCGLLGEVESMAVSGQHMIMFSISLLTEMR